jgi:hypothetical protein
MRSTHFAVQGFDRTYWDFYLGAGFSVGVLYFFAAVLAWQLGGLPPEPLALMRVTVWGFAWCFTVVSILSWRYLFWIPIVMSALIAACLAVAAWCSARRVPAPSLRQ